MEWLFVLGTFMAIWITIVFKLVDGISDTLQQMVFPLPFAALVVFGVYSLCVIIYRVITFNDCVEAAEELKKQIKEARKELTQKGMTFT